jgi:hypothetical protein
MPLIIYTNKEDTYLEKVKEYADFNGWSLSKAVRQILKAFVQVNMGENIVETHDEFWGKSEVEVVNEIITKLAEPKLDPEDFYALQEAKVNVNQNMEDCIKDKTNAKGEVSCYFFDNGREHHPYCKSECWTQKRLWGKRVRL